METERKDRQNQCVWVCGCVCVCERERGRQMEKQEGSKEILLLFLLSINMRKRKLESFVQYVDQFYDLTQKKIRECWKIRTLCGLEIQCDQMARLFFNICAFTAMKISPMSYKIYQSSFMILTNTKYTRKILPKT